MFNTVVIVLALMTLPVLTGCSSGAKKPQVNAGSVDAAELGDLSAYKKIAEDTLANVEKKDMVAAKARIKDLETAWDDAEGTLKPKSEAAWTLVDKAIDHALAAVRIDHPNPDDCVLKLKTVIVRMSPKSVPMTFNDGRSN